MVLSQNCFIEANALQNMKHAVIHIEIYAVKERTVSLWVSPFLSPEGHRPQDLPPIFIRSIYINCINSMIFAQK